MLRSFIRGLFLNGKKRDQLIKDLGSINNSRTREEVLNHNSKINETQNFNLADGEIRSIYAPDLGNQKGLRLTKWYFENGDLIKTGDIICDIENDNILMEFETVFSGRLNISCELNEKLTTETEIFKVIRV